jgi:hypothetical protein
VSLGGQATHMVPGIVETKLRDKLLKGRRK